MQYFVGSADFGNAIDVAKRAGRDKLVPPIGLLNLGQLFEIDAFHPILQLLRVGILELDLHEVPSRDHHPGPDPLARLSRWQ